jgi:hypothetical protein
MSEAELANARLEAVAARERMLGSLHELQARLNPAHLANAAWDDVRDKGAEVADDVRLAIVQRPLAAGATLAGITALLARKPICRLIRRLTGRNSTSDGDE